jgi:NAD(P)-dependent dehydrogenase (short-subunit alcohol dehydrogenase family)
VSGAAPQPTVAEMTSVSTTGLFDLHGRVAVVTGATSGLGDRFVRVLRAAGADVVAAGRRADRLDRLAAEVDGVQPVVCDVTDADARAALIASVMERRGRIDVLVNNAGIGTTSPAEDESVERFREVVEVNLTAVFALSQLAGRVMLAQGSGSVINLASMFGIVASAPLAQASYCASKAGVINLTREIAAQWARRGVRANALAPGFFPSEMTEELLGDERSLAWARRNTPMGRPGRPHELDGVLLLLASQAGAYITGQVIAVDGGWTAR